MLYNVFFGVKYRVLNTPTSIQLSYPNFLSFSAHMREAQKSGVAETVDHEVPSDEEVDRDMQLLTKQQERLMNELKKAYQDEAERARELEDEAKRAEMEERLRAMNLHFSPKNEEDLDELKTVCFLSIMEISLMFEPRIYYYEHEC